MVKIKTLVLICGMMISGQAMAEEKLDLNKVGENIKEFQMKVSSFISKEWQETKEFQKTNWQSGKEQTVKNIDTIKKFFGSLTNKKNNEE